MAKTVTTKYGTKINVEGLNDDQVKRVLSVAQDNGAYGVKGATLADELRKKNAAAKPAAAPPPAPPGAPAPPPPPPDTGVNPKTGAIDPTVATTAVTNAGAEDTKTNFELNNPASQVDASGNARTTTLGADGTVSVNTTAGAPLTAANNAFTAAATGFTGSGAGNRQGVIDANYAYLTKNNAQSKAQEVAAAKQDLAQRGIPIDPSPNGLWGKTLKSIDDKYQSLDDQAHNQAISGGDQSYATQAGVVGTLGAAAAQQNPTDFSTYAGATSNQAPNLLTLINTMSDAELAKYGIDQDTRTKLKQIAASSKTSGRAPASTDNTPVVGGSAPGFGV